MFFPGPGSSITQADYKNDYEFINRWNVSEDFKSINDIYPIDDWIYITYTPTGMIRTRSFDDFANGIYQSVYEEL